MRVLLAALSLCLSTPAAARDFLVTFWLVLYLPGQPPIPHSEMVGSLDECFAAARHFLTRPTDGVLLHGGKLEASCVITVAPSVEN